MGWGREGAREKGSERRRDRERRGERETERGRGREGEGERDIHLLWLIPKTGDTLFTKVFYFSKQNTGSFKSTEKFTSF